MTEEITVTALSHSHGRAREPVATRQLSQQNLATPLPSPRRPDAPASRRRAVPAIEFAGSNPLPGISLRPLVHLASPAPSSRDDVPLNVAFADTVHWQEQPELATRSIELVARPPAILTAQRHRASVNVVPLRPTSDAPNSAPLRRETLTTKPSVQTNADTGGSRFRAAPSHRGYIQEAPASAARSTSPAM